MSPVKVTTKWLFKYNIEQFSEGSAGTKASMNFMTNVLCRYLSASKAREWLVAETMSGFLICTIWIQLAAFFDGIFEVTGGCLWEPPAVSKVPPALRSETKQQRLSGPPAKFTRLYIQKLELFQRLRRLLWLCVAQDFPTFEIDS